MGQGHFMNHAVGESGCGFALEMTHLGPPVVPFYQLFGGRVPLLK